jgi:hypothetical protein
LKASPPGPQCQYHARPVEYWSFGGPAACEIFGQWWQQTRKRYGTKMKLRISDQSKTATSSNRALMTESEPNPYRRADDSDQGYDGFRAAPLL